MVKGLRRICNNFICSTKHWRYSLSLAFFTTGILFIVFSMIDNNTLTADFSGIIMAFALFAYPNFSSEYVYQYGKSMIKFCCSIVGVALDCIFIKNSILLYQTNREPPMFFLLIVAILTFFLSRYYWDVIYRLCSAIIHLIRKNIKKLKASRKIIGATFFAIGTIIPIINTVIAFIENLLRLISK